MYTPLTPTEKIELVESNLRLPRQDQNGHPSAMPLHKRMEHYEVPGVSIAVIEDAQIEWAKGYGTLTAGQDAPVKPGCLFQAASMTKLVTAVAALRLVADGVLGLDADVNETLHTWQIAKNDLTRENPVTLRRLLAHQSGIVDPVGSFEPLADGEAYPPVADILAGKTRFHSGPVRVTVEAECEFNYSDAGYCVVEQLMMDATGKRFEALVRELVFKPLGMTHSLFHRDLTLGYDCIAEGHDEHGDVVPHGQTIYPYTAAAGLWTTPSDMAVLLSALMCSLQEECGSILPRELACEMIMPQGCTDWTGLGVFVDGTGQDVSFFSQGWGVGFQCFLNVYPMLGMGAVVMANSDPGLPHSKALTGEIMRSVGHVYLWPDYVG